MKQVSYDLTMRQITQLLVGGCPDIEDGYYRWILDTESVTSSIPRVFMEQRPETLPGHIVRIVGIKVIQLLTEGISAQRDDTFFIIKNGEVIFYGDDRTPSGFVETPESLGENC